MTLKNNSDAFRIDMENFVVVILGPTASGKSSLAVEIAKKLNGEVVSADSMQIYTGMNIATAKPTSEEMQGIRHHLLDFLSPGENFSVAKYKSLCEKALDDILKRGKLPIICGGTGLYIDSVIQNTQFIDASSDEIRQMLYKRADDEGIEKLFDELKEIDPKSASLLSLSDKKRIIRALELYYSSGITKTQQNELSHLEKSKYNFCIIGLDASDRNVLYDRIEKRVDEMVEKGLVKEAEEFFSKPISSTAKQAIGYKELKPFLDGKASLDSCIDRLKTETRHYAKRQLTWFRKNSLINRIYIDTEVDIICKAIDIIKAYGGDILAEQKQNTEQ